MLTRKVANNGELGGGGRSITYFFFICRMDCSWGIYLAKCNFGAMLNFLKKKGEGGGLEGLIKGEA